MANQTIGILMYNVAINVNMAPVVEAEVKASKFADTIKKIKTNAAQAAIELGKSLPGAIIGLGTAALTASSNFEKAMSDVQGATGATKAQMEETREIAENLYTQNFGKDWADLGNAITAVKTVTGQTGDQLENTTRNAILLKDVFGFKLPDSVKTVDTMMRQFGITSEQSMNLLAQGTQKGLNKSGDLLESANKYSNQFKSLGFTAEGMFNVLSAGSIEGAYQLDKVGLAVKEFNSKSQDNSESTKGAFTDLGFNADAMMKTFAAGGPKASQAFSEVLQKIAAIEDPLEKNRLGVALMGNQFKELEVDVITAMGNATDKFDMTAASMDGLNQIKFDKPGEAFAMFGRQIETGFLIPIGQKMLPHLTKLGQWLTDHKPQIEAVGTAVGDFLGKGFDLAAEAIRILYDKAVEAIPVLISFKDEAVASFNAFTGSVVENKEAILAAAAAITTFFLPALIRTGIQATISGAQMLGSFLKGIIMTGVEAIKTAYKYAISGWAAVGSIIRMTAAWVASKVPLVTHKALLFAINVELIALKAKLVLSTIAARAKTAALRIMTFTTTSATAAMRAMTIGTWLTSAGTWAMTAAQWALNSAFLANPITWIVVAIIAVIAAAILIFKNWGTIGPWLLGMWTLFKNGIITVFNSIVTFFSGWVLLIKTAIVGAISWIVTTVTGYWTQITTITTNVFNGIITFFSGWVLLIKTAIVGAISWIVTTVTGYWTQIKTTTTSVFTSVSTFFTDIWNSITGFFQGIDLQQIGRDIIQGLINGIVNTAGAVVTAITNVASDITTGIKNFLRIKSPSRVMMEVGYYTGEGLADGITGTQAMVSVASTALAGEVTAPYMAPTQLASATAYTPETAPARTNAPQRLEIDLNIDMKGNTSGASVNSDMAEQMKRVIQEAVDSAIRRMGLMEVEV
ncbi:phage tail tape measure protein [Paenibacillus sp. L3-i20]|uniref:phage tail tape measure protein n=1 Tax=Paenibacillus sp. L3-i20 TaxID=2905833 RepID=UPI001EDE5F14|nr:phage tail tape measure protein [Paenibacillus sp. L3-i20]